MSKIPDARNNSGQTPKLDVASLVRELQALPLAELLARYVEVCGHPASSKHKQHLIKRLVWQIQAKAFGGLPQDFRQRAIEQASFTDLRRSPPRSRPVPTPVQRVLESQPPTHAGCGLMVGTELRRVYKGRTLAVLVRRDGFEFEGEVFPSLTAVATRITGSHWNGLAFFGVRRAKPTADQTEDTAA